MLAVRRLRISPLTALRGNTTLIGQNDVDTPPLLELSGLQSQVEVPTSTTDQSVENTPLKRPRQRPTFFHRGRPNISIRNPRKWNRPLAPGVLPAYDEALKVIRRDSADLKTQVKELKAAIAETNNEEVLERLTQKLKIVEVQSEINLPSVRWSVANGMADMSNTVHRHLVEQRWRNEGTLDLLMERIHQMNVIPDVLEDLHPSFDLRVSFHKPPWKMAAGTKRMYQFIEPGIFLLPKQTLEPPRLYTSVFHTDTRLYTLLMVDPDVPDERNFGFQTYLHWLQPNIPLSAESPATQIPGLNSGGTYYIPPHPQKGTKYHRYVLLLLQQPSPTEYVTVPAIQCAERLGFNVRRFMSEYGLDGSIGGGAHMWREVWDEDVSRIYSEVLQLDEPRYGRQPRPDRYAEVKHKRYT